MNNSVVVIRGDVIGSRKIDHKEQFWKKLDKIISILNKQFGNYFLYPFEIFSGDEITGICKNPKDAYIISSKLIELLHPDDIRIVISEGELDKQRKTKKLTELDGEVFWKASQEIAKLKESGRFFSFALIDEIKNSIISNVADLLTELKHEWTKRESEIIRVYEKSPNQLIAGKELGITQQSISAGIKRSKFEIIRETERSLIDFI